MRHPRQHQQVPKIKDYAKITLANGTVMSGYFFIEATSRVQDVLNSENGFFPFITEDEEIHLLNKFYVLYVEPLKK